MNAAVKKYLLSFPYSSEYGKNIMHMKPECYLRVMILTTGLLVIPTKIGVTDDGLLTATLKVKGIGKYFGTPLTGIASAAKKFTEPEFKEQLIDEFKKLLFPATLKMSCNPKAKGVLA